MSQTNADRVRAGFQAFDRRGLDAVGELFAPDAEWFAEEGGPAACHGRQEILATYQRHLGWGARGEVTEAVEAGEHVVLGLRVQYPEPEPEHEHDDDGEHEHPRGEAVVYHVFTIRDDKIVRMQDHPDRDSALQAIGRQP